MTHMPDTVRDFLAARRIAVAGVSRDANQPANLIYRRLRDTGHQVVAVNPAATEVEGDPCWPDLASVPDAVDAVVVATPPAVAPAVVRAAADRGVPLVWMHRSFGEGSVSPEAVALCRERGIRVIVGGCPMMYCGRVDPVHRCMRWILDLGGRIEA
ncbi:MAG TPA: CoA-binding protein [Longimicrobiales bacterium]|nr:CoA-binding protein [Longimicrobiales bacterium]